MADDSSPPADFSRWYNLCSATELSGYTEEDILRAIERGEIRVNTRTLGEDGIRDKDSWIIIDRESFQQWFASRATPVAEADIRRMFAQIIRAIGELKREIHGE